jgi:PAS domain S-box-containing protein
MSFAGLSEAILDSLSEGVFTVGADWRITSFNRAAEEITGIARTDAIGQLCAEVLHSSLCEKRCPIRRAMEGSAPGSDRHAYFVDVSGERIPIAVSAAVLRGPDGEALGGVEIFRDLSEIEGLRSQLRDRSGGLVSQNPAMQNVLAMLPILADNPISVLICGETGSGKEVVARAIHEQGPRASSPFVAINCGALPDHLLESELFGYKRGAFTGAVRDKPGRFSLVGDGTLFLDEIGEISPAMQVRLLRVLQEREFEPLGGTRAEAMPARIIAASHRDLEKMVKDGDFREDLYYRLDVIRLEIPPLRERREDIPALCMTLLERSNARMGREVAGVVPEAMNALQRHDWPGNIRQLANVIERAVVLCRGEWIDLSHLPSAFDTGPEGDSVSSEGLAVQIRRRAEGEAILDALKANDFDRRKTAAQLGMHPTSLYRKIKAWRLVDS